MSVEAEFVIDAKTGFETVSVATPFDSVDAAASKVQSLLKDADPYLKIKDQETGEYHFLHAMKLADVTVYEIE